MFPPAYDDGFPPCPAPPTAVRPEAERWAEQLLATAKNKQDLPALVGRLQGVNNACCAAALPCMWAGMREAGRRPVNQWQTKASGAASNLFSTLDLTGSNSL